MAEWNGIVTPATGSNPERWHHLPTIFGKLESLNIPMASITCICVTSQLGHTQATLATRPISSAGGQEPELEGRDRSDRQEKPVSVSHTDRFSLTQVEQMRFDCQTDVQSLVSVFSIRPGAERTELGSRCHVDLRALSVYPVFTKHFGAENVCLKARKWASNMPKHKGKTAQQLRTKQKCSQEDLKNLLETFI